MGVFIAKLELSQVTTMQRSATTMCGDDDRGLVGHYNIEDLIHM